MVSAKTALEKKIKRTAQLREKGRAALQSGAGAGAVTPAFTAGPSPTDMHGSTPRGSVTPRGVTQQAGQLQNHYAIQRTDMENVVRSGVASQIAPNVLSSEALAAAEDRAARDERHMREIATASDSLSRKLTDTSAEVGRLRRLLLQLTAVKRVPVSSDADSGAACTMNDRQVLLYHDGSKTQDQRLQHLAKTAETEPHRYASALDTSVYLAKVLRGDFDGLNVTCRCLLTRRSKFCKEKNIVIERFDHMCPWIDNAVGLGNQRGFFVFLILLVGLLVLWFFLFGEYFSMIVFYERLLAIRQAGLDTGGSQLQLSVARRVLTAASAVVGTSSAAAIETQQALAFQAYTGEAATSSTVAQQLAEGGGTLVCQILVLIAAALNLFFLGFVVVLLIRHSMLMLVNLTVYESMVSSEGKLAHVDRRFPDRFGTQRRMRRAAKVAALRTRERLRQARARQAERAAAQAAAAERSGAPGGAVGSIVATTMAGNDDVDDLGLGDLEASAADADDLDLDGEDIDLAGGLEVAGGDSENLRPDGCSAALASCGVISQQQAQAGGICGSEEGEATMLWWLSDFGVMSTVRHVRAYWSCDTTIDERSFRGPQKKTSSGSKGAYAALPSAGVDGDKNVAPQDTEMRV